MSTLREATLRLADWFEDQYGPTNNLEKAADELRRLHAENAALRAALEQQELPKGGGNLPPPLAGRAGAAAQREKVAHWMRSMGYATGHGDTIEDLLDHLGTQISEGLEAEVLMEREACADICYQHASVEGIAQRCAEQIRARSKP
jgi:hypothetical protein